MKYFSVRATLIFIILAAAALPIAAQRKDPPTEKELAEITARGRMLAEYDAAAWHSTDAVMALSPKEGSIARYVAKKTGSGWMVAYGRFNEKRDKFLIVYEAAQGKTPQEFKVTEHKTPKEDAGFYLSGAHALGTAIADFKGERRPYNAAVIPAPNDQMWVYIMPAPTQQGIWPLGGDARYLISKDGKQIIEKRQLHKSIIEYKMVSEGDDKIEMGVHTAVLDDIPEDTDVFLVLTRKPQVPEWVITEKFAYHITVEGTIFVMLKEVFLKIGKDK